MLISFRNRHLEKYKEGKIVEYVNAVAKDVQKNLEACITDQNVKEAMKLANVMSSICDNKKPHELPLVLQLKAETDPIKSFLKTNNVQFA